MTPPRRVTLREMTPGDIAAGLRLCRQSHWNQVERDWRQFLALTPGGAAVAVDADDVVMGSVATMRYDEAGRSAAEPRTLAWIAMVLVDPAHRGAGIGTALLQHGLDRAADVTVIGLDATPLGQPIYERLGFLPHSTLIRLQRAGIGAIEPATGAAPGRTAQPIAVSDASEPSSMARVRQATGADLDAIAGLDAIATGLDRRAMLTWLLDGAAQYAWVSVGKDGAIDGAMLGRQGHSAAQLGPIIAASEVTAQALLAACLRAHPTTPFFIDVADSLPGWRTAVESLGFTMQRPFTRMYRGDWRPGGDARRVFAIIGPEFG